MDEGSNSVAQFLEDRTILVTGAPGFLAKVFVEKILRTQPKVKKLYLLLRAADTQSATQRLHSEVLNTELFRVLRERWGSNLDLIISSKIMAVAGDISLENLGVMDSNLKEEMQREIEIVVNVAATTDFYDRYDVAMGINTFGALNVLNFAKKCDKIMMLLHVSTAYVCGEREGLLLENSFYMGETLNGNYRLDIDAEKKIIEEKLAQLRVQSNTEKEITSAMKDFGVTRARMYGWPNTYVFTKAMGEMLLWHSKGSLPLVIIRPTMIASTLKEPFPGWIEGLRTIDSVIAGYGKGKITCFLGNPKSVIDVIPVDMVVNAMIVAMVAHANHQSCKIIFHVCSSNRNPVKFSNIHDFSTHYFTKNPWINRNEKSVKVGKGTVLSNMSQFQAYMGIHFMLPLKGLHLVNTLFCQYYQDIYTRLHQKIELVMRLVEIYRPYAFFKGIFDDSNLQKLRIKADSELDAFNFNPKCIDWEDYFTNIHIPGLVKYVMK